jgi:hypothetical protein
VIRRFKKASRKTTPSKVDKSQFFHVSADKGSMKKGARIGGQYEPRLLLVVIQSISKCLGIGLIRSVTTS